MSHRTSLTFFCKIKLSLFDMGGFFDGLESCVLGRKLFQIPFYIADWLLGSPLNPKLIFSLVDWIRFLKESILYRQPHFYF